jgi:hypothetical protein
MIVNSFFNKYSNNSSRDLNTEFKHKYIRAERDIFIKE